MPYKSNLTSQHKTNIVQVVANKRERGNATYVIPSSGEPYFNYKGERIKEKHFDMILPIEVKNVSDKGENPCKKYAHFL